MWRWEPHPELRRIRAQRRLGTLAWTVLGLLVFFVPVTAGLYFGVLR